MVVRTRISSADTPARLTETPPENRFCDLVLNGGVASGVVYPWAILKLARHYRFKSIGGNSVGAMAAALAAAAEYGRCHGVDDAFEPLRRLPLVLAEEETPGRTKMLSLFQPTHSVRRLFALFLAAVSDSKEGGPSGWWAGIKKLVEVYRMMPVLFALAILVLLLVDASAPQACRVEVLLGSLATQACHLGELLPLLLLGLLAAAGAVVVTALVLLCKLLQDLRALAENGYGLCTGKGRGPGNEALIEWLHRGIQLSAGRGEHDAPLTFADLWSAPRFGQAGPAPLPGGLQPTDPGIDLQMFTSNVTQGRPVRLPLNDSNTRLYYDPTVWKDFFPSYVLAALEAASTPYAPASSSDPDPLKPEVAPGQRKLMEQLRELPSGGMPLVVAARLSLSFPLLFSCVPLWAVDYETKGENKDKQTPSERVLLKCQFSDGGLCSNFPVHLFDAAHPRWPTFAILLDSRLKPYENQQVWLPLGEQEGRGDNWQRMVPGAELNSKSPTALKGLVGLALGIVLTMKDWNDRVAGRLPQIRNRIVRMALRPGEGQLNIAMPGERIMTMAHAYGTEAATQLVAAYEPKGGESSPEWRQHLYVRAMVELRSLRRHLRNYALAARSGGDSVPLRELLQQAQHKKMLLLRDGAVPPNGSPGELEAADAAAVERAVSAVEVLERELAACERSICHYRPKLEPELHLRAPV